jgi:hypothetical protein
MGGQNAVRMCEDVGGDFVYVEDKRSN